jgi:hypothetical protein
MSVTKEQSQQEQVGPAAILALGRWAQSQGVAFPARILVFVKGRRKAVVSEHVTAIGVCCSIIKVDASRRKTIYRHGQVVQRGESAIRGFTVEHTSLDEVARTLIAAGWSMAIPSVTSDGGGTLNGGPTI